MQKAKINLLVAFILIIVSPLTQAQQKLDIVKIMGQFIQASYAASKCIKPDKPTLSKFLLNFRIVTARAVEELKKRDPSLSDEQIMESLKQRSRAVESAIDSVLSSNGCEDSRIKDLLKRFEIQAKLQL